jgi:xanthine dehydrogenase small subunit
VKSALATRQLIEPRTLDEALRICGDEPDRVALAGCTDVYVGLNFGTVAQNRFINLWPLEELRGIRRRVGGGLHIGALTTFTQLRQSPLVLEHAPLLAQAGREIGGVQIQNRATLGGNLVNASPAADSVPVLAVAEAIVVVASTHGRREIPLADFFTGYRQTALRAGELLVEIIVPPLPGVGFFRKVGTRAANAISKVVMAAVRAPRPRLAFGSVAPTVVRAPRTEAALAGGADLDQAAALLRDEIAPIDDLRSTGAYRRQVVVNLLRQFWTETAPPPAASRRRPRSR